MPEPLNININSPAVQKHVEIIQGVIQRMADNSRYCKVWCVTLVSAVLVLVARTGEPRHALIALAPAILLYLLDAYYLMLERRFRKSYNVFVGKVQAEQVSASDLYAVAPSGSATRGFLWSMFRSFSVLPFYVALVGTVFLAWWFILY